MFDNYKKLVDHKEVKKIPLGGNFMKKSIKAISLLLVLLLLSTSLFAQGTAEKAEAEAVEVEMTHEEMVEKAKSEGTLTVYTHSSRTTKIAVKRSAILVVLEEWV